MSDFSPALTEVTETIPTDTTPSRFDEFGGHYSVLVDGVEVARWAPSSLWSDFAAEIADRPGWTYTWVATDGAGVSKGA
jgi:hypothetical protein